MSDKKLPFDCTPYIEEFVTITNPFSGESIEITGAEAAVYDTIMGAQHFNDYKTIRKGLDWFRKHFPAEYMVLLD